MPNSRPGCVCVCGFLLTWAGQRRSCRSLVSHISAANSKGQLPMSQEYVWLCLTVGTRLGRENVAEHNIWCRMSLVGFLLFPLPSRDLGLKQPTDVFDIISFEEH